MSTLTQRQADILAVMSIGQKFSASQIGNAVMRVRHGNGADLARYHLGKLRELGYTISCGTDFLPLHQITPAGMKAIKNHTLKVESAQMPPPAKVDKFAGTYRTPPAYYRNNGHTHLPSRGIGA